MANMTKESVAAFIKTNFGEKAAKGFKSWSAGPGWNEKIARYTADYNAFKANGGSAKDLSVDKIYAYLKASDPGTAEMFLKYASQKDSLAGLKQFAAKFAGQKDTAADLFKKFGAKYVKKA